MEYSWAMKHKMRVQTVIWDYERRGILPDKQVEVAQGLVCMWLVCGSYAAMVRVGRTTIAGESLYLNTYSAQEIADDILPRASAELVTAAAESARRNYGLAV